MHHLTDDRPKCLVEFRGKPLLDWQLAALRGAGIDEIGIVTGYQRARLADRGLVEFHNPDWAATNMVSSLACAADWLRTSPCIVSYSDIFYSSTAPRLLAQDSSPLRITYDPNWRQLWERRFADPLSDAETFRIDCQGRLLEIGNRPTGMEEIQGQYMGLLGFTPTAWQEVERLRAAMPAADRDRMHMTGTLQRIIEAGRLPVKALPYPGLWGEIDSPTDIEAYDGSPE